jgi:5'-3' exoribonuclease 2
MQLNFILGQPFKPFEQLMGVFPAARLVNSESRWPASNFMLYSRSSIPEVFHTLMTDQDSPIIDFYPSTFEVDMNGKKMSWQGVALLPFIDQKRLLDAMEPLYPKLTEHEQHRNKWGDNLVFVSDENPLYPSFEALYGKRKNQEVLWEKSLKDFG